MPPFGSPRSYMPHPVGRKALQESFSHLRPQPVRREGVGCEAFQNFYSPNFQEILQPHILSMEDSV